MMRIVFPYDCGEETARDPRQSYRRVPPNGNGLTRFAKADVLEIIQPLFNISAVLGLVLTTNRIGSRHLHMAAYALGAGLPEIREQGNSLLAGALWCQAITP